MIFRFRIVSFGIFGFSLRALAYGLQLGIFSLGSSGSLASGFFGFSVRAFGICGFSLDFKCCFQVLDFMFRFQVLDTVRTLGFCQIYNCYFAKQSEVHKPYYAERRQRFSLAFGIYEESEASFHKLAKA